MLISLIATTDFSYEGRSLSAGDHFETSPIQAAALTYQRKARFARKRDKVKVEESADSLDVGIDAFGSEAEPPRRKRQYRRRDMKADE